MLSHNPQVVRLIRLALEEDLAQGDITSELLLPTGKSITASIIARESMVMAGLPLIETILREAGAEVTVKLLVEDGAKVRPSDRVAVLKGDMRRILAVERTVLNFLQRLSGVATYTSQIMRKAGKLVVLDTRKTTPGWRVLEKYAVRTGGGRNHRFGLGDMILIKNNHIDALSPSGKTDNRLAMVLKEKLSARPFFTPVEIEVRNVEELNMALTLEPDYVMLDNMSDAQIIKALKLINSSAKLPLVEVSGGVTPQRLKSLSRLGVDCVSLGALTTQAVWCDISMRIDK